MFVAVRFIGLTDSWEISVVEHIDYNVAHGNHVVPPAGRSKIELVQARVHYVAPESWDFFLVDMLECLLVYYACGEPKVD